MFFIPNTYIRWCGGGGPDVAAVMRNAAGDGACLFDDALVQLHPVLLGQHPACLGAAEVLS